MIVLKLIFLSLIILSAGFATIDAVVGRHGVPAEAVKSARLVSGLSPGGEYQEQCADEIGSGDSDENLWELSNAGMGACLTYPNKAIIELLHIAVERHLSLEVSAASAIAGVSLGVEVDSGRCFEVVSRLVKACPVTVKKAML